MENNKKHILVVDDDDRIRELLKDYLTENNYIVSTAENAEDAKSRLEHLKFDILILDVMMPGQNGYDLTKEVKKRIKVPIICEKITFSTSFCSDITSWQKLGEQTQNIKLIK